MTEQRPVKPYSAMSLLELAQNLGAIRADIDAGQPFDQVCMNTLNNVEAELVRRHNADSPQPEAATASSTTSAEPPQEKDPRHYGTQHNLPDASFFDARTIGGGYLNAPDDFGDSAKEE